jgi:hypothetical protein
MELSMTDKPPSIGAKEHKMSLSLAFLKNSGRAAVTALVFGAAALVAMPAMADSGPSFSFGIQIPGGDMRMGPGHFRPHPVCLNDDDVANELEDAGWRHVQVGQDLGRGRVVAFGSWGRGWYQMVVNRCTGAVFQVQRVSPDFQGHPDNHPDNGGMYMHGRDRNGGMGLQFNFGN